MTNQEERFMTFPSLLNTNAVTKQTACVYGQSSPRALCSVASLPPYAFNPLKHLVFNLGLVVIDIIVCSRSFRGDALMLWIEVSVDLLTSLTWSVILTSLLRRSAMDPALIPSLSSLWALRGEEPEGQRVTAPQTWLQPLTSEGNNKVLLLTGLKKKLPFFFLIPLCQLKKKSFKKLLI